MGCGPSRRAAELLEKYPRTVAMLGFKDSINALVSIFSTMDADGDGSVTLFELLNYCDIDRTPFMERTFAVCDQDDSKRLDFREFAFAVWHFATLERMDLVGFLFDLYDRDQSGSVDKAELQNAIKDCFGKQGMTKQTKGIMAKLEHEPSGSLSRKQFVGVFGALSEALFPAVKAQQDLRLAIMGNRFWRKAAAARRASPHKNFPPSRFRALFVDLMEGDLTVRGRKANAKRVSPA